MASDVRNPPPPAKPLRRQPPVRRRVAQQGNPATPALGTEAGKAPAQDASDTLALPAQAPAHSYSSKGSDSKLATSPKPVPPKQALTKDAGLTHMWTRAKSTVQRALGKSPVHLKRSSAIDSVRGSAKQIPLSSASPDVARLAALITDIAGHPPELLYRKHGKPFLLVRSPHSGTFGAFFYGVDADGQVCGIKQMQGRATQEVADVAAAFAPRQSRAQTSVREARGEDARAQFLAPGLGARNLIAGDDGKTYIVTKLMDGSVDMLLHEAPTHAQQSIGRTILRLLATQLGRVHDAGYIHSDVKLENALWSRDGAIEVADLGMARMALNHTPCGTYAAPEMYSNKGVWGKPGDVFCLAISLAQTYNTGRTQNPFTLKEDAASRKIFFKVFEAWRKHEMQPKGIRKFSFEYEALDRFFRAFKKTDPELYRLVLDRMLQPAAKKRATMREAAALTDAVGFDGDAAEASSRLFGTLVDMQERDTLLAAMKQLHKAHTQSM